MDIKPFHIAVPISNLDAARAFYGGMLECPEGRSTHERIDFNFFGHHLVTHVEPVDAAHKTTDIVSSGLKTPVRHFGVVLEGPEFDRLAARLKDGDANFYLEPMRAFPGEVKEQQIMLVHDNCGNIIEFKATTHGLFDKQLNAA